MEKTIEIFGTGISGCTMARLYAEKGYKVNFYESKKNIGGNCYDFLDKEIYVHKFGPHIFHTSNKDVINFVKKFAKFNGYKHRVLVNVKSKVVPLPINFQGIKDLFGKKSLEIIKLLKKNFKNKPFVTLYELMAIKDDIIQEFTKFLYNNVYGNYTSKMWGVPLEKIDPNVISRVKIILSNVDNYFPEDKFQGLPSDGYTYMMKNMINHKNIKLFLNSKKQITFKGKNIYIDGILNKNQIFYSGPIDQLLNFKFGVLPYRSLDIKFETIAKESFQDASVVNYPAHKSMTRISEYKKMTLQSSKYTIISKEYPGKYDAKSKKFCNRYYPIHNKNSELIYKKYCNYFKKFSNFHMLGRLAEYRYYDMDDAIANAISIFKRNKAK